MRELGLARLSSMEWNDTDGFAPSPWMTAKRWPDGSQAKAWTVSFISSISTGTSSLSARKSSKEWKSVFFDFVWRTTLTHK